MERVVGAAGVLLAAVVISSCRADRGRAATNEMPIEIYRPRLSGQQVIYTISATNLHSERLKAVKLECNLRDAYTKHFVRKVNYQIGNVIPYQNVSFRVAVGENFVLRDCHAWAIPASNG
jgi:hypothetical protein